MDHPATPTVQKPGLVTLIAGGCLTVLFTALCIIVLVVSRQQVAHLNVPTSTPTLTPVPRILVHPPSDQSKAIHEDFSSDENLWALYYDSGKLEVINGKMILQSNVPNTYEIGSSGKLAPTGEKYYVQADFSTDIETSSPYGLLFGASQSLGTYYLFEIHPQDNTFRLSRFNSGEWTELVPVTNAELNPYPFSNTLSVYFDRGNMELYINGRLASQYTDKDFFQSKDIGMFVSNTDYRLLVDDLFIYSDK